MLGTWIHACSVQTFWNLRDARKFVELYLKFHVSKICATNLQVLDIFIYSFTGILIT